VVPAFLTRIISPSSPVFPVLLIVPLACLYFVLFRPQAFFTDTVYLGGDMWEYQSMAVNVAYGHGVNKFGGVEPFEVYGFGTTEWHGVYEMDPATYEDRKSRFMVDGGGDGSMNTFRMPLYSLFLGVIYSIAGVHPLIAKNMQLLLLVLVAGGLPLLGYLWWGKRGLLAGVLAGAPFVASTIRFTEVILVESLAIFVLFLCLLCGAWYEKRPGAARAALLGVSLGICLLTKLSLILLPFFLFFLIWWHHPPKDRRFIRDIFIVAGVAMALVLPWSMYASMQTRSFIIFSTESLNQGMFDAHNEYTAIDGEWHPEWETDLQSVYNRDGMKAYPDSIRIMHFYLEHPMRLVRLPLSKMVAAFTTVPSVVLLVILLMLEGLLGSLLSQRVWRLAALVVGLAVWWMAIDDNRLYTMTMPLVNTPYMWTLFPGALAVGALVLRRFLLRSFERFPLMVTAVILNFFFIMILVMSDSAVYRSRHVKVADFLCILLAAYMLVGWIAALLPRSSVQSYD